MTNESKPNPNPVTGQAPNAHDHENAPDQERSRRARHIRLIVIFVLVFAALAIFGILAAGTVDEVLAKTTTRSPRLL